MEEKEVKEKKSKNNGEFADIEKSEKKYSIIKIVGNFIFWVVFAVFIILAIIAYMNYNKLENDEEPSMYSSTEAYKIDADGNKVDDDATGENVTVYNYYIYKIVEHYNEDGRQVSLKLWFLDDVTKD